MGMVFYALAETTVANIISVTTILVGDFLGDGNYVGLVRHGRTMLSVVSLAGSSWLSTVG